MMINELENNAVFTTEYLNTPPAEGDLAAICMSHHMGIVFFIVP